MGVVYLLCEFARGFHELSFVSYYSESHVKCRCGDKIGIQSIKGSLAGVLRESVFRI